VIGLRKHDKIKLSAHKTNMPPKKSTKKKAGK
jgi:hypothetical protein